ncbi:hypothetical protein CARUB_v10009244mg [Capsella rubella]|uniref:FBD domain-containing protein n=1 Tax=Capsella rubella TaxID=81985 RepID=R0IPB6_9BRAS|nr:F-box protein At4g22280 isoform X1 [Capsella rubella]EOA40515.1 hypothetical protein CARUB_v10009244mg [Capsella rubella]
MDRINGLSDDIICHILSFLPTKQSALTCVLSKRWRNLFALAQDLHLVDDDALEVGCAQSFIDFVDRVLVAPGDAFPIRKLSIKCRKSIDSGQFTCWMFDVLKRGVVNLDIDVIAYKEAILVPVEMFTCRTMVELKLAKRFEALLPDDVSLPSLKTLFLDRIFFYNADYCVLGKILSASPVLEELTICNFGSWQYGRCCRSLSSSTLKKLTIQCPDQFEFWDMTLDAPSLTYLEYSDLVPREYPAVNLESLVEAKLDLRLSFGTSNPTNLIKGLTNVEVLDLSSVATSEMFYFFCEVIPVFSNLIHLSITTDLKFYCWKHFPILVERSPNLHTLVIKGPLHANECKHEFGLSSPVKVLKITEYGGKSGELKRMKFFLEKLSCLELVKVLASAINDKEMSRITKDLLMVPRSSNCNIKIKSFLK